MNSTTVPGFSNDSCDVDDNICAKNSVDIVFFGLLLFATFLGFVGFIKTVVENEQFHAPRWYLLANLAVCDMVFAIVAFAFEIGRQILQRARDNLEGFCRMKAACYGSILIASMIAVIMAIVEHFIAVMFPKLHNRIVNNANTVMVVFVSWIYSVSFTVAAEILLYSGQVGTICTLEVKFCPVFRTILWTTCSLAVLFAVVMCIACFVRKRNRVYPAPNLDTENISPIRSVEEAVVITTRELVQPSALPTQDNSTPIQCQGRVPVDEVSAVLGIIVSTYFIMWGICMVIFYLTWLQIERRTNLARTLIILFNSTLHPIVFLKVKEWREVWIKQLKRYCRCNK